MCAQLGAPSTSPSMVCLLSRLDYASLCGGAVRMLSGAEVLGFLEENDWRNAMGTGSLIAL